MAGNRYSGCLGSSEGGGFLDCFEADVSDLLSVLKPIRAYGDLDIEVEVDKERDLAIHLPPPEKPPGKKCPRCHGTGFV